MNPIVFENPIVFPIKATMKTNLIWRKACVSK